MPTLGLFATLSLRLLVLVDNSIGEIKMDRVISFGIGMLVSCYLIDPEPFEVMWQLSISVFG